MVKPSRDQKGCTQAGVIFKADIYPQHKLGKYTDCNGNCDSHPDGTDAVAVKGCGDAKLKWKVQRKKSAVKRAQVHRGCW
jgi:hypothetical protein